LVDHLETLGDNWDEFLPHNGFVTTNPDETLVIDKPMMEKPRDLSQAEPDLLGDNPCERAMPEQSLCEQ